MCASGEAGKWLCDLPNLQSGLSVPLEMTCQGMSCVALLGQTSGMARWLSVVIQLCVGGVGTILILSSHQEDVLGAGGVGNWSGPLWSTRKHFGDLFW